MTMTASLSGRRVVGTDAPPPDGTGAWARGRQDVILDDAGETDEALVTKVASGDRRAYGLLVDRHLDRTVTIARRILNNQADAEDVAQEAFLRLWRHADRFDPTAARFGTWFYRITTNLCLDRTRRTPMAPLEVAGDPVDPGMDQERSLSDQRTRQAVAAAVADLPDRLRAAVTLTYDGGLSNVEAAKALDVSVKALESLLVRARRALREKLAGWGT